LTELTNAARAARRSAHAWAGAALVGATIVASLLAARQGTPPSRLGAAIALGAATIAAFAWEPLLARRFRDARQFLLGPVARIDAASAHRALRALSLMQATAIAGGDGTSTELAQLHVTRAFAGLPAGAVVERASRMAARLRIAALVVVVGAFAVAVANAGALVEGADVLVARGGVAPLPLPWLDGVEVSARPPEYLHQNEAHELMLGPLLLPYGTAIAVSGTPNRTGRRLFLSDGATEVPFVDDGAGAVVARWTLAQTVTLRVVARFGDVVIPAPEALHIESLPDALPVIDLETAPRTIRLVDATEDVPVRFRASDDHGLREVHLVLRSGTREERRVLARLDGETRSFQGGNVLPLRDPFVTKSHVPVSVTVEAEDNDPLTGPKWGASPAITLVPPDVGEPEALRIAALRVLRDRLVDSLAAGMESEHPGDLEARRAAARDGLARAHEDDRRAGVAVDATYGGLRVASRIRALVAAQREAILKAAEAESRAPGDATHDAAVKATERFALVADAIVHGLGVRDARASAKLLADVADDLVAGEGQMRNDAVDARSRGAARVDAALEVLSAGGRAMHGLGDLGRDIGEIVEADLLRVRRAGDAADFAHAELAARDLAARLRQPDPSFGSRGSGRAGSGGESGNSDPSSGRGDGDGDEKSDDVQQAFNEAVQDLERLAQEHAGEVGQMERALAGAESDEEAKDAREEARRHAEAIREAARRLPAVGMGSDSWTSKGAAARDLAEQMAHSLEDGRPDDATQSGRSAVGSLDEAKKMLQRGGWLEDPQGGGQKAVEDARRTLENESRWAEDQVKQMRRRAADRARDQLRHGGEEEERMAERARELAQRGKEGASFPEQAVESLDEAARSARQAAEALKQGDADRGLDRQHEAQRQLESAREQLQDDDEANSGQPRGHGEGDGNASHDPVAIPDAKEHKGPEEFRRRVIRGLGLRSNGALHDAVQRYAEGLLR
jgi:hypothetical protein